MKLKSSEVLQSALNNIIAGHQQYACAAIQDVETSCRLLLGENVTSSAQKVFNRFMPRTVNPAIKLYGQWWPKGDYGRIVALENAISYAESVSD
jgi:hypothetical protein